MANLRRDKLNKLLLLVATLACLAGVLFFTDPNKVPLPILIIPFLLIGCVLYQMVSLLVLKKGFKRLSNTGRLVPLSIAFLGVSLLLLRSLHQLTVKDSLLVFGFAVVFWLYIWRADFLHK